MAVDELEPILGYDVVKQYDAQWCDGPVGMIIVIIIIIERV